ncbi:penicillin acylase family protein [Qipengyuania algicida]|nr:penicillin acylase family protein [Qipengyuania algicida]
MIAGLKAGGSMAGTTGHAEGGHLLAGLHGKIHIIEDERGIPHVRAESKRDAFFAQGYLVARDRLFQIDLDHRQQLGRMAEVFGPAFLAGDRAARLFHYRGDVNAELAGIPDEVRECVGGYVDGINARIAETRADPSLLTPEYAILGITPLIWDLRELVTIRGLATSNVDDEIRRAMLAARDLLEYDNYLEPLRPAHTLTVPEGLDVHAVSKDDLGVLGDLQAPSFEQPQLASLDRAAMLSDLANQGSNAWTVAGSHTATGRPILANDPHLSIGGFSPRHVVHLTAPGLDVMGAGYPGLPGIMQGHTDRFAFGRTNFHIDQTDLYILDTKPDDPGRYYRNGEWEAFDTFEELISVKGATAETVTMHYADGRPVIADEPDKNRAVAAATVSMLPGANMRFAIVAIDLAHGWDDLLEAFKLHVSPTNLHYADVDGNIAWHAIGFTPRRKGHDGLFPVPGDGRYDWDGLVQLDEMPSIVNPEQGWIASANAYNVPASYPIKEKPLSFTWNDPYRHDRIAEVLSKQDKHSIADSIALMHDVQSLPARAFKALLPAQPTPDAQAAADMLRAWDCEIGTDSAAALLYEMFLPEIRRALHQAIIPQAAQELVPTINLSVMLDVLTNLDPRLGDQPAAKRDELMNRALAAAWAKAFELAGDDPKKWRWGDLHRVEITHPLAPVSGIAETFPAIDGGRSGGDATTVMARGLRAQHGWDVRHGASFLFAADVGDWDRSRFLLLPGQSIDPASPHYRDFYRPWLDGDMQPMDFSPAAVAASRNSELQLIPTSS